MGWNTYPLHHNIISSDGVMDTWYGWGVQPLHHGVEDTIQHGIQYYIHP